MKSVIENRKSESAFTLIELLVVITIIVVLLALLTPALDKAVYQAQLAVCGTKVRGIAEAATLYATANRRSYPYRQRFMPNGNHKTTRPKRLWSATGNKNYIDERPYIRPYVASINKQFQCVFLPEMNLDVPDIADRPAGQLANASYQFWYGWQYEGHKGMIRLGDRFSWTTEDGREHRFDVLANDHDLVAIPGGELTGDNMTHGSHPDKEPGAVMSVLAQNNEPLVPGAPEAGTSNLIWSRWQGPYIRGLIDMNFAHADNSVDRFVDVMVERDIDHTPDERMVRVPEGDMDEWKGWRNHLPATNH